MAKESIEETIKSLKHEIERLQAVNEIQNLMGTYEYLHTANLHKEVMELYAKKAPGVRVYWGEQGYWEGPDAPKRCWSNLERMGNDTTGMMAIHPVTTPVIVVAGDGKTAKGVWIGTGFVASVRDGKPGAMWEWDKYGVDFIKEDGKWKFWHFHIYRVIKANWDETWAQQFEKGPIVMNYPPELKPDKPGVDDNPYLPDTKQLLVPKPPEPYETWDPKMMY
jgi:hypothetical protein